MKRFFFLLWIAFFSWSSVAHGAECPANKAIYTSITDNTKIFKTTDYAIYKGWRCEYYYKGEEDIPNTELVLYPYKLYDKDSPYRNAGRDIPEIENYKKECKVTFTDQVTKGLFNSEVVYYWVHDERTQFLERSYSETNFEFYHPHIFDRIIWLDDATIPKADTLIVPRSWNIHDIIVFEGYSSQSFGKDIMALTGCGQDKNLYGNKYLSIGLKEAEETGFYDQKHIAPPYTEELIVGKETLLHGPWKGFVLGRLSEEGHYDKGMKVGHWKYYDNAGKLWSEGSYKNGKKDGVWTTYDTDGLISETATWVDGELEGA